MRWPCLREVLWIPTCHSTTHGDTFFVINLLQQAKGEAFQPCQIVSRETVSQPAFILAECHIQTPMKCVLDRPVATHCTGEPFDTHANRTKEVTDF
jgi:hypothetical protein